MRLAQDWEISVHTQIRVTHSVSQAILETIQERHIDLTLLGWRGQSQGSGLIFNDTLDTLIRQAPCGIVLVKLGQHFNQGEVRYPSLLARLHLNRWLVPTSGGPNAALALELLPALVNLSGTPEIQLFQAQKPTQEAPLPYQVSVEEAQNRLNAMANRLGEQLNCPIETTAVCAYSIPEAVLDMADHKHCDVIVLGASREGMLQQVIQGNVPEAIARQSRATVILVRGPLGRLG